MQRSEKNCIKPIPLIWVDTNKGDKNSPFVRSSISVRECKKGRNAVESLEPEQLLSAMPLLEALKLLVFSKGVPEDFPQEQAFETSSFRHFPGALHAESTP